MRINRLNARKQAGASLIEVLVTALILAVGLLGLAALQARSMQYNHASALRSQANVLSSDILDRMRVNHAVALALGYNIAYGAAAPTGTSLVAVDLQQWKGVLRTALPNGDGAVNCTATAFCTISIQWQERAANEDVSAANRAFSEFTYTTRL